MSREKGLMRGLEIKGLRYSAGGKEILAGVDLAVECGTVHALIGTNGTGKSTLANIIMGLEGYAPSGGTMAFMGRDIGVLAIHERAALGITLAWQEPVRFEGITIRDYLALGRHHEGRGEGGPEPEVCLGLVGLDPGQYLERFVDRSLSGGERKRVELASALAMGARLVVLDEPDSGIDILSIKGVAGVIRAFSDGGAGVLVITHREEIARAADLASHLCFGRVVNTGDPAEVAEKFLEMRCLRCPSQSLECDENA